MIPSFVILDRDGVINHDSPDYIKSPDEWIPIDGSLEAITLLSQAGVDVYVATNQAGIARGKLDLEALAAIHGKMNAAVRSLGGVIKDISYCPHHPDDGCGCRKPEPGMLLQLAREHGLDLPGQPFVGDSFKDLLAAEAAGCLPVLVKTGKGADTAHRKATPDHIYDDLMSYVEDLMAQ